VDGRVFVGHAGQGGDRAGEVFGWLVDDGHRLFFDRDLRAGLTWGELWERGYSSGCGWVDAVVCLGLAGIGVARDPGGTGGRVVWRPVGGAGRSPFPGCGLSIQT